jgi:ABC-type transporter Mla subunit MlaD
VAGAAIGALLGHMAGWIGGTRDAIRRAQHDWYAANVRSMTDLALDWITRAADDMDYGIRQSGPPTVNRLQAWFETSVKNRRDRLSELLDNAQSGDANAANRQAQISAAAKRINRYERLGRELARITSDLERLVSPDGTTT